jgi:hypothetical protein
VTVADNGATVRLSSIEMRTEVVALLPGREAVRLLAGDLRAPPPRVEERHGEHRVELTLVALDVRLADDAEDLVRSPAAT